MRASLAATVDKIYKHGITTNRIRQLNHFYLDSRDSCRFSLFPVCFFFFFFNQNTEICDAS